MVEIKLKKLTDPAYMPTRATKNDAGWDIRANTRHFIGPYKIMKVSTGIAVEIPEGYELQVRGKSGVAVNLGLTIAQGIGTIDSGYRGEICVLLKNMNATTKVLEAGEMIGQLILGKILDVEWKEVKELGKSDRGTDGFGQASAKQKEKEEKAKKGEGN